MQGRSEYMEWAKTRSQARFNLASSGVAAFPLAGLPVRLDELELTGPSFYGYPPLLARLARRCGVPEDCVLPATGTSMANFLVMAALLEPGDHVLVEQPTYGPLVDAARFLRADVRRFARRAEEDFRLDPAVVEAAITPRTRLVVLTNPHNPSSAVADEGTVRRVGEIARAAGARLLVDEVYLEASSVLGRPRASAFGLGPEIVVTSSLTKVYGLGGLRCGWALAEPDLVRRMWRLDDLMGVVPAHPAERLSIAALDHLDLAADHARRILLANRAAVNAFLDSRPDLRAPPVAEGMLVFPKVLGKDVDALVRVLHERHETTVVPGRFFDAPDHVRISVGALPETVAGGIARLGEALDSLRVL